MENTFHTFSRIGRWYTSVHQVELLDMDVIVNTLWDITKIP